MKIPFENNDVFTYLFRLCGERPGKSDVRLSPVHRKPSPCVGTSNGKNSLCWSFRETVVFFCRGLEVGFPIYFAGAPCSFCAKARCSASEGLCLINWSNETDFKRTAAVRVSNNKDMFWTSLLAGEGWYPQTIWGLSFIFCSNKETPNSRYESVAMKLTL